VDLALIAHASMPLKFWDEAFLIATFLINLLPSKAIDFDTPTERLLGTSPNYDALRIFGCLMAKLPSIQQNKTCFSIYSLCVPWV
jgi:hypothetical protein